MSYELACFDGSRTFQVTDKRTRTDQAPIALLGTGTAHYGVEMAKNLIYLTENFASDFPVQINAKRPLTGQCWYDKSTKRLRVNSGTDGAPVWDLAGKPVVGDTEPSGATAGDLWFDTTARALRVHDGDIFNKVAPDLPAFTLPDLYPGGTTQSFTRVTVDSKGRVIAGSDTSLTLYGRAGQCRLVKSGTILVLLPYDGNKLFVPNLGYQTIPAGGVAVGPTAALIEGGTPLNRVTYYVYASVLSGALVLQLSATGHVTNGSSGVEVRAGDPSRVLVGMCRLVGGAFVDTAAQRFVISRFNRCHLAISNGGNGAVTTAAYSEINANGRVEFLTWAEEAVFATIIGSANSSVAGSGSQILFGLDGAPTGIGSTEVSSSAGFDQPANSAFAANLSEGYHYLAMFGNAVPGAVSTFSVGMLGFILG